MLAIFLPQPPKLLELQECSTMPSRMSPRPHTLGIEVRALYMQGKCSLPLSYIPSPHPLALLNFNK